MLDGEHAHAMCERILLEVRKLSLGDIALDIHEDTESIHEWLFPEIELGGVIEVCLNPGLHIRKRDISQGGFGNKGA